MWHAWHSWWIRRGFRDVRDPKPAEVDPAHGYFSLARAYNTRAIE